MRLIKKNANLNDTIKKYITDNNDNINQYINNFLNLPINGFEIIKDSISSNFIQENKNIDLETNLLSIKQQDKLFSYIIKKIENFSEQIEKEYKGYISKEINEYDKQFDINKSTKESIKDNSYKQISELIQKEIDNNKTVMDSDRINNYCNVIVKDMIKMLIPNSNITNNEEKEENKEKILTFDIEYIDSNEAKLAIEYLKNNMNTIDNFDIRDISQTAKKYPRLKIMASKKVFAVQDLFKYLQVLGFNINIIQSGMCATYYEGADPSSLNGNSDVIFYYASTVAALIKKKNHKTIYSSDDQPLLPEGKEDLTSGFYVVLNEANPNIIIDSESLKIKTPEQLDSNIKLFNTFKDAEDWLLNRKKNIMSREIINDSFIVDSNWSEYEKKIYENVANDKYVNGPVNDVNYRKIEISLPNNPEALEMYKDWLNKYKKYFKSYTEVN